MIYQKRFYFTGTKVDRYWAIYDNENKDEVVWIDCPRESLDCIIKALNESFS